MQPELALLIGDYPYALPIRTGELQSNEVKIRAAAVHPVHAGFRAMARDTAYDLAELALITALQAIERRWVEAGFPSGKELDQIVSQELASARF